MRWIICGSISGFLSVALGAFGAHALNGVLSEKALTIFHTGINYQFYHSLALILFGQWSNQSKSIKSTAGWAFALGILLFCGSLYLLAITEIGWLGMITPLGGISFLVGWFCFAQSAFSSRG
jgi:uncharacterized membrane protein YgdD (TMEM256/DUF423 family)